MDITVKPQEATHTPPNLRGSAAVRAIFDADYYLRTNPDVAQAGADPLQHFLDTGWAEGRKPHPLFDTDYYIESNADIAQAGINPLIHYVASGAREGRNPSPLFHSAWYRDTHADIGESNPLAHYIHVGAFARRNPNPLFDADWYVRKNPDAAANPLAHYVEHNARTQPHPLFDPDYYLAQNPDVAEAGIDPLAHYLLRGHLEQRRPHADFDAVWYLKKYPDVAAAGLNPLVHYVLAGKSEGRETKAAVVKVAAKPLGAHECYGEFSSKLVGDAIVLPESFDTPLKWKGRLAVHLHLFHQEMAEEFKHALLSVPCEFALYVSVPEAADTQAVERQFRDLTFLTDIRVAPVSNRGRDIAPMLTVFADQLKTHDLLLHIHTKRSSHTAEKSAWAAQLTHHLLHSRDHTTKVLNLFADNDRAGVVFPVYHPSVANQIKWGANFANAAALSKRFGLTLSEDMLEPFPAGSFFFARRDAIEPLLGPLPVAEFSAEAGQQDGTLAHAVERLLTIVSKHRGYSNLQVQAAKPVQLSTAYIRGARYRSEALERLRAGENVTWPQHPIAAKNLRVAVLSCASGGYDAPLPHEAFIKGADYFFYADNQTSVGFWQARPLAFSHSDPVKVARRHKTQPHKLLSDYDIVVWIDANISIVGNVSNYIDQVVRAGASFGTIPHSTRKTFEEEAKAVAAIQLDSADVIATQVERYKAEGYCGQNGLTETNFMVMDLRHPETKAALDIWWNEISQFSRRDQLSFDYAVWKAKATTVSLWSNGLSVRANPKFACFEHGKHAHPYGDLTFRVHLRGSADVASVRPRQNTHEAEAQDIRLEPVRARHAISPTNTQTKVVVRQITPAETRNPFFTAVGKVLNGRPDIRVEFDPDLPSAVQACREHRAAIVHFHQLDPFYHKGATTRQELASNAKRLFDFLQEMKEAGARLVWTKHNPLPHARRHADVDAEIEAEALKTFDRIIVLAEGARDAIRRSNGLCKVDYIPHPTFAKLYPTPPTQREARRVLGLALDDTLFGTVGEIKPYKGLEFLIETFRSARTQLGPRVKLLIVGNPADTHYYQRLKIDLPNNVIIVGQDLSHESIPLWLAALDASVFSFDDIWVSGSAILSLSMQRPAIAPDIGFLHEYIEHDNTGFLYKHRDSQSLIKAMQAWSRSPYKEHYRYMCAAFSERHALSKIASQYENIYRAVFANEGVPINV